MTTKPWEHNKGSGGEGSETDALATRFVASLDVDTRLYEVDIRGSIAHATMLENVGLITADDLAAITQGLNDIKAEIDEQGDHWPGWKVELEDVHMCIEAALIEKVGDPGRKLHTGRSRNDQVALDIILWITDAESHVTGLTEDLCNAYDELAKSCGEVVLPSYTHLQRAQPIVVGGELMAWRDAFSHCAYRSNLLPSMNFSNPLGSGAIAGSTLPLDREQTRESLEFVRNFDNSMYATASRDAVIDFVYALSMTAMWLSRWAEQWIIYKSAEFNFITMDARYTTGSSMMPQKQNPDMLELIRGKAGGIYGDLMALLSMCKGLTIGYNRDLQDDKRHLFHAYDSVCDCLEMAARIVRTTTFNEDHIKQSLSKGYLDATVLAEYLVTKGVPFRTAHQQVGALVHQAETTGKGELGKLTLEEFNAVVGDVVTLDEEVYDWLGAENVVKRYQSEGNAGLSGYQAS